MEKKLIYPNSPLQEVVCEVRFDGNLAIDGLKHLFHERIRAEYPRILVPKMKIGDAPHLVPFHFQGLTADSPKAVLAINRFSLHHYKYLGHEVLHTEFFKIFGILQEVVKIPKFNRIGMRYINLIPYTKIDGTLPIKQFLNLGLNFPDDVTRQAKVFSTQFQIVKDSGLLSLKLDAMANESGGEAFLLDFDYSMEGALDSAGISSYFLEARNQINAQFEAIITDSYRQFLRGEAI